jgi:allantoicase
VVAAVVVDTAHFTGNFPPQASVECAAVEGHPTVAELERADWRPLLPLSDLAGDTANTFPVESTRRVTHVRLTVHPDGGVARLRVHGTAVPDPRIVDAGPFDLAALDNGALVTGVSDDFYGRPAQLVSPGLARSMGEGWETRRRRGDGNDWVQVSLACEGVVTLAELDTSYFLGNAPGSASLTGSGPDGEVVVLPRTRLQPDTRHRFVLEGGPAVDRVRLDVFPDGGMARPAAVGPADRRRPRGAGTPVVRRAARRPGAGGPAGSGGAAGRGGPAGRRPPAAGPAARGGRPAGPRPWAHRG